MRTWESTRTLLLGLGVVAGAGLVLAACSTEDLIESALERADGVDGVDIDAESGSFSFEGEDGEFTFDIDEETGEARFGSDEGDITTSPTDEVPSEIAAVVDLPDTFEPQARIVGTIEGVDQVAVQGAIRGDFDALLDEIEQGVRAHDWPQVERGALAPGQSGTVMAEDEAAGRGLVISLLVHGESDEPGRLHVQLFEE